MSYFDFFRANIERNNEEIIGTCHQMCPQEEIAMREKEILVHVLEVLGSERKLVKCFGRSAADANTAVPRLLRPYAVLRDTVKYLLLEVTKRIDVPTPVMYDFVNDRLRAVRQDMTIQRLPPGQCVNLLEPMVRFHVFYGYKLCELPIKDYDPVLNKKYLLECLKWFLSCSDTMAQSKSDDKVNELSSFLSCLDINKRELACDRVLMESMYLLCNLEDVHPLLRYLSLPKNLKSDPTLQLAYRITVANLKGNYIEVCRLLERLCPLTYCALCIYLPTLQRRALQVMSQGYTSKKLTVPISMVRRWLRYSSDSEAAAACAHYGLAAVRESVRFSKAEYSLSAPTLQPKKLPLCEEKLNMSIDHIFTYRCRQ